MLKMSKDTVAVEPKSIMSGYFRALSLFLKDMKDLTHFFIARTLRHSTLAIGTV